MHYYLADNPPRQTRDYNKMIGIAFLLVFLVLMGKIWVPYAMALFNATAIRFLPPDWSQSYAAATLPQAAVTDAQNKLIIHTDSLNIEAPIIEGSSPADLLKGVGHEPGSALPGEQGRVVISGHRFWPDPSPWATVFFSLDKLKVGNKIELIYNGKQSTYTVTEQWDVPKNEAVPHLAPTTDPLLTIYTCGPTAYSAKNRLGFNAVLDQSQLQHDTVKTLQTIQDGVVSQ